MPHTIREWSIQRGHEKDGVTIVDRQSLKVSHVWVRRIAKRILELVGKHPLKNSISIVFVDNGAIKEYNRIYRGEDASTDVLAFPSGEGNYLGDIIISVERVKDQAPDFGFSFNKELALLIAHGILHLLGYQDCSSKEREEMERLQFTFLRTLENEKFFTF